MNHIESSVLIEDMRKIIEQTEELLRATSSVSSETVTQARKQAQTMLSSARKRLWTFERRWLRRARDRAEAVDRRVHAHPWQSVGVALLAGLTAGLLLGRSKAGE